MSIKEIKSVFMWVVILMIALYILYQGRFARELLIAPIMLWVILLLRFLQENYFKRGRKDKDV